MNASRRGFLASALLAVPVLKSVAAWCPIVEQEMLWDFVGEHPATWVTTYTNGTIEVETGGVKYTPEPSGSWTVFRGPHESSMRLRRPAPFVLEIDYISIRHLEETS